MFEQVLVLAYRNADGHLRVGPKVFDSRKPAVVNARAWARLTGLTIRVLDFAPEIQAASDKAAGITWEDDEEDYLANHQHIMADTPDGRQCRICYYS